MSFTTYYTTSRKSFCTRRKLEEIKRSSCVRAITSLICDATRSGADAAEIIVVASLSSTRARARARINSPESNVYLVTCRDDPRSRSKTEYRTISLSSRYHAFIYDTCTCVMYVSNFTLRRKLSFLSQIAGTVKIFRRLPSCHRVIVALQSVSHIWK